MEGGRLKVKLEGGEYRGMLEEMERKIVCEGWKFYVEGASLSKPKPSNLHITPSISYLYHPPFS